MAATFSMVPWLIGWQQPLLFGCKVSAVYVYAIATHECGHAWAARYLGLPTAGFVIEPFGGWSSVLHSRHWDEVFISAMGPVFSLISAGPLVVLYVVTGDVWWAMAAFYLLFGQAINLLPVWKLDGGRLADALFYRGKSWHWDAQLNAKGLMVGRILYASLIVAYLAAIAVLSRFVIVF
jgi:Zn-dependent protease